MKIGMIGTNFISDWMLEAEKATDKIQIYSIFSRNKERAEKFAKENKIPKAYSDFQSFLEDEEIEAVYIASPNFSHYKQAIAAMKKGKHVLCEKVISLNTKELEEMIRVAKECRVVLLEAMRPDFDPAFQTIEENMGKIGQIRRVRFEFCQYSSRYEKFKAGELPNAFNPELSNAAITDMGVYCIHTMVRLFGKPMRVKSFSLRIPNGVEGAGSILLEYPHMLGEISYSKISDSIHPNTIEGEEGTIGFSQISNPRDLFVQLRKGEKEEISYTPVANNMVYELEKFHSLVRENKIEHPYLEFSLETLRIIDQVRQENGIVFAQDSL